MKNPFLLILLGLAGAGKGTQGPLLATKLDAYYLVSGDLIREIYAEGPVDDFHKDLIYRYDRGIYQPDENMNRIFQIIVDRLAKQNLKNGLIVDSYPLSMTQVEHLEEMRKKFGLAEPIVIYLDISADESLRRLQNKRLVCVRCKKKYSFKPSEDLNTNCQKCDGELIARPDDKPDVVKRRFTEAKTRIEPLLKYFGEKDQVIKVNGEKSVDEVFAEIMKKLKGRI